MLRVNYPKDLKDDASDIAQRAILKDERRSYVETRIGMMLSLYYEDGWMREKRLALLECLELYLSIAGNGVTHWQNWDSRRLKKFKEVGVPEPYRSEEQLDEGQPYYNFVRSVVDKDGVDPGHFLFMGLGVEKDSPGNRDLLSGLKIYLPPSFGFENRDVFLNMVDRFCDLLKPEHGSAGLGAIGNPGVETMRSAYYLPWLIQYPGLEYDNMGGYLARVDQKDHTLPRSSNWLTILGNKNIARLGGVEAIDRVLLKDKGMALSLWQGGVTIIASDKPTLGDSANGGIPEGYRRAAQIIKRIRFEDYKFGVIKTPKHLGLDKDQRLKATLDWLRRFD